MKVEIKNGVEKEKFPVLMISRSNSQIILFTDYCCGVVINQGSSSHRVGHYITNFVRCVDDSAWEKFTGEITLKND